MFYALFYLCHIFWRFDNSVKDISVWSLGGYRFHLIMHGIIRSLKKEKYDYLSDLFKEVRKVQESIKRSSVNIIDQDSS